MFFTGLSNPGTYANTGYKPMDKSDINALIPSSTRFVVDLGGKWECSNDGNDWQTMEVPGAHFTDSKVYLRRTIRIEKNLINSYTWQLYFMGLDEQVEIYFNEQFVGKYFGGMTPFKVQIPKRLIFGETNNIKLVVISATDAARKLKEQHIFAKKIYTGILREIMLIGNPNVWVSSIKYKNELRNDKQNWNVRVLTNIASGEVLHISSIGRTDSLNSAQNNKSTIQVEAFIRNPLTNAIIASHPAKTIEIEPSRNIPIDFQMGVNNPNLWSPESPNLYQLVIKVLKNGVLIDEYSTNMGFKDVQTLTYGGVQQLFLNGKPLEIKGVDYFEDFKSSTAISTDKMEQDIYLIKTTLGANAIRLKNDAPHPYLAYLCDKHGLMMLIELPLYDAPTSLIGLDEVKVKMKNLAERMVENYHNNISVLGWGLYDGIVEGTSESKELIKYLTTTFRYYSDKPIYKTIRFGSKTIDLDGIDFLGFRDNKRYNSTDEIKKELGRLMELSKGKPAFVTYGFPIQPDNHHGYSDPLSIESQAFYILNLFHAVRDKKLTGSVITSFNDYELNNPLMMVNNQDLYLCTAGLVDIWRKQRLSFSTLQSLFNSEKEPLLSAGSYTEKTPILFIILGIIFSIIIVFLINRYKRFREYFIRALLKPYNFYADIRDQRIISNTHTLILGFVSSLTLGIYLASLIYYYRTDTVAQLILILIIPLKSMQDMLFSIVWSPELLLLLFTVFFMILAFVIAFIIRLFAIAVRGRIYYKDTLTIVVWAGSPIILLLPFSVILIRLLVFSPAFMWVVLLVFGLMYIWVLMRTLKATSVVFDVIPSKTYIIGLTAVFALHFIVFSIYQYQFSIFSYTEYIFQSLLK